jgi:hypothetical protein
MSTRTSIVFVLLLELGVVVLALLNYGWEIDGLQAIARYSGRLSLFIFSIIFLLHHQPGNFLKRVLSEKFFLVFAVAHGVHLVELLSYVYLSRTELIPYRLAGGMLAYSFIFVMPWLHERFRQGKLPEKRYNQFSLLYLYYVWFIFVMTYVPRVMGTLPNAGGSYSEFVVLLGWVFLMLGIKLSQLFSKSRVTQSK